MTDKTFTDTTDFSRTIDRQAEKVNAKVRARVLNQVKVPLKNRHQIR